MEQLQYSYNEKYGVDFQHFLDEAGQNAWESLHCLKHPEVMRQRILNGETPTQIAEEWNNVSAYMIIKFLKEKFGDNWNKPDGYTKPTRIKKGSAPYEEIVDLYMNGWTYNRIAIKFGLHKGSVHKIIRRMLKDKQ